MFQAVGLTRFVRRLSHHSAVSGEARNALLGLKAQTSCLIARSDYVLPGDTPPHASLIVDGLVGRFEQTLDGRRQVTALYVPGDMCDLSSIMYPRATSGLQALTTTTVAQVRHHALRSVAEHYPTIATAFWKDLAVDAAAMSRWMLNVGRKDAVSSCAYLLCEMGVRMERAGLGDRHAFSLPMNQAQLADALALSTVHANRTLQELRRLGVLFENGAVRLRNWRRLASLAEFPESVTDCALYGTPEIHLSEPAPVAAYGRC